MKKPPAINQNKKPRPLASCATVKSYYRALLSPKNNANDGTINTKIVRRIEE